MPEKCPDPGNCPVAVKVEALENRFDEYRKQSHDTHVDIYDRLNSLERSESRIDQKLESIEEKLDKDIARHEEEQDSKAKRWSGRVDKLIDSAIGILVGFILAYVGLK